jgi:hippurate hydrolase
VVITGKSVHLSRASEGKDAMLAGMEFLQGAYAMAEEVSGSEDVVLRFGKMTSGTVRNSLSGQTVLAGSMRTYKEEIHESCMDRLRALGQTVEENSGCTVEVSFSQGYPAVWNNEKLLSEIEEELGEAASKRLEKPNLAAEDFSFYQKQMPGVFFFVGVGQTAQLHAPEFDFDDEAILPCGVDFLEELVRLKGTN